MVIKNEIKRFLASAKTLSDFGGDESQYKIFTKHRAYWQSHFSTLNELQQLDFYATIKIFKKNHFDPYEPVVKKIRNCQNLAKEAYDVCKRISSLSSELPEQKQIKIGTTPFTPQTELDIEEDIKLFKELLNKLSAFTSKKQAELKRDLVDWENSYKNFVQDIKNTEIRFKQILKQKSIEPIINRLKKYLALNTKRIFHNPKISQGKFNIAIKLLEEINQKPIQDFAKLISKAKFQNKTISQELPYLFFLSTGELGKCLEDISKYLEKLKIEPKKISVKENLSEAFSDNRVESERDRELNVFLGINPFKPKTLADFGGSKIAFSTYKNFQNEVKYSLDFYNDVIAFKARYFDPMQGIINKIKECQDLARQIESKCNIFLSYSLPIIPSSSFPYIKKDFLSFSKIMKEDVQLLNKLAHELSKQELTNVKKNLKELLKLYGEMHAELSSLLLNKKLKRPPIIYHKAQSIIEDKKKELQESIRIRKLKDKLLDRLDQYINLNQNKPSLFYNRKLSHEKFNFATKLHNQLVNETTINNIQKLIDAVLNAKSVESLKNIFISSSLIQDKKSSDKSYWKEGRLGNCLQDMAKIIKAYQRQFISTVKPHW
mgnify:CR=1 FL=1